MPALSDFKTRIAVIALLAIVVASSFGFWSYGEYKKREFHRAIVALATDASVQLRGALSTDASVAALEPPQPLEDRADQIDRELERLRRSGGARNPAQFDAIEMYVITARELLRRQASAYRDAAELAKSRGALRELMQQAGHRSPSWFGQAMRAKKQFETDAFNYRLAVDAIAKLLDSMPEPRAQLAPYVDPGLLLDEGLRAQALERARDASKRTAEEVEQVRRFVALR